MGPVVRPEPELRQWQRFLAVSGAVLPVHSERVAALVALHVLWLPGDVLPLVAPRADEVRLVDDAPGLGAARAHLQAVLGDAPGRPQGPELRPRADPRLR